MGGGSLRLQAALDLLVPSRVRASGGPPQPAPRGPEGVQVISQGKEEAVSNTAGAPRTSAPLPPAGGEAPSPGSLLRAGSHRSPPRLAAPASRQHRGGLQAESGARRLSARPSAWPGLRSWEKPTGARGRQARPRVLSRPGPAGQPSVGGLKEGTLGPLAVRLLLVETNEEWAGKGEGIPFSPLSPASFGGFSFCVLYLPCCTGRKLLVNLVEFTLVLARRAVTK